MDFVDFSFEVTGAPGSYSVRAESPFMNPAHSSFALPYDDSELEAMLDRVELAILKGSGRRRALQSTHLGVIQEFGSSLFTALVSGDVEESYYDAFRRTSEQGHGLRIRLTAEPAELAGLPWELLFDPRQRDFVSLTSATPLVRHLRTPNPAPPLIVSPPLRVLVMVATPNGLYELDVDSEKARLLEALEPLVSQGFVQIGFVEGGTWRDLQEALFGGPWHVFHFIGHGSFDEQRGEGVLAFERETDQRVRTVTPAELGRLIDRDHSLRLVVLNACEGARGDEHDALSSLAARLVYRSVPAALAMQWEISDEAAIEFSRTFYRSLSAGSPVDAGVSDARISVSMAVEGSLEWATPVLFMRSPDGRIFDVEGSPIPPDVAPSAEAAPSEPPEWRQDIHDSSQAAPGGAPDAAVTSELASLPPKVDQPDNEAVALAAPLQEQPGDGQSASPDPPSLTDSSEVPHVRPAVEERTVGISWLRVLFLAFLWHTMPFVVLGIVDVDILVSAAPAGGVLAALWVAVYWFAVRRVTESTGWTRAHAVRSVPYVPFRLGGVWNAFAMPVNAFVAHLITFGDVITDFSLDDWSALPFFAVSLVLPLGYWVAVRRFIEMDHAEVL